MISSAILVVEDDGALREALCDTLALAGYRADGAGDALAALERLEREPYAMVLSDVQMRPMDGHTLLRNIKLKRPELPVLLMTAYGTIQKAVEAMREGAVDYLVKPVDAEALLTLVQRIVSERHAESGDFVAADPRSREIQALAARVAESDATVLITGESGVGKEVLARYIHNQSPRAAKPFVAINCAAIPENMLEATLFGYEKGAFTGAIKACPGKFEQAQGGTLLLDEISEMDLALQAKLLRVLQEREVERLGGSKIIDLDVRVLATSNRTMRDEVACGRFREDLFYRLNVFPIELPPLRQRRLDIVPIAERLLARAAKEYGRATPTLAPDAAQALQNHAWPGNVRELDNVMQRALILQRGAQIRAADLRFETSAPAPVVATAPTPPPVAATASLHDDVRNHEAQLILDTLRDCLGNRKAVAGRLGISERTLRYKMARLRECGLLNID
jgi:two-component system response regulator FlrC